MTKVLLANLDFEYDIGGLLTERVKSRLLCYCHRFRHVLRLVPEFRGLESVERCFEQQFKPGTQVICWGQSPSLESCSDGPPVSVVRELNSKVFSHGLERDWGVALPHSRLISDEVQFEEHMLECPFDWVLKDAFGVSGRERLLGRAGRCPENTRAWLRKRLMMGRQLLFEPWVDKSNEWSLHYEVGRAGDVKFLGSCELLTDRGGVHRGNLVCEEESPPQDLCDWGWEVAKRAVQMKYWGPLSIDSFQGELDGFKLSRPITEINARYSFGRLSLHLRDWIAPDYCYAWLHPKKLSRAYPSLEGGAQSGAFALPLVCDPNASSGTLVLVETKKSDLKSGLDELLIPT